MIDMVPRDLDYAGIRLKIISSRVVDDDDEGHGHEDGEHGHHPRPRHGHGHKCRHDEYGEPDIDDNTHGQRKGHLKRDTPIFSKVSLRTYLPAT